MKQKNSVSRCKGLAKIDKPCRAAAIAGGLCFFHVNPNKASELGRIGGRKKNCYPVDSAVDPMPTLDNPLAVRDAVSRLIADVYAGKVHPRVGAGLAPVLHLQLEAKAARAATINYGVFFNAFVGFLMVAVAVFLLIRQVNRLKSEQKVSVALTRDCPFCLSRCDQSDPLSALHVRPDGGLTHGSSNVPEKSISSQIWLVR